MNPGQKKKEELSKGDWDGVVRELEEKRKSIMI